MSHDDLHLAASGQTHAFIRDGALILYFDQAETPFVARFDLDSLAQANFEVADKKDGIFHLTLRDYSGDTQTIGQFSSKNDAHQALYLILQALLEMPQQAGGVVVSKKPSLLWRVLCKLVKGFLILLLLLGILYALLSVPLPFTATQPDAAMPAPVSSSAPVAVRPSVSEVPDGEAVDADVMLNNLTGSSAQEPTAPSPSQAPTE